MRRSVPSARGSDASGFCGPASGDGVLAVCLLALVGIVVIGGLVMLFSWVTTTLPTSQLIACPEFDGCVMPPEESQTVTVDSPPLDEPRMSP